MELFDFRAFADAAGVFNVKSAKPYVEKWFPWKAANNNLLVSKFVDLASFRGYASTFIDLVFARIEPVETSIKLEADFIAASAKPFYSVFMTRPQPVAAPVAEEKPRKTLTLKTKVDLPVIASIGKASSTMDLASAFKSEMKVLTERKVEAADLHAAFAEKRKHPLSGKSWQELAAAAETVQPKKAEKGIDLAAAFKREMEALMASEQKAAAPAAVKPAAKPKKLAA